MTTILHIDASARMNRSISRALSQKYVDEWCARRPHDTVIRRDIGLNPPPATTEVWIGAVFTNPADRTPEQKKAVTLSDEMIDELSRADVIVMGTPMYNYGLPTALKGWVDQVIRVDKTFSFDLARGDYPLEPIMSGKFLVLLTSSGEFGFAPGGIREDMNHLDTHIATFQHYLGVSKRHHIAIEYQEFSDARHERSVSEAHDAVSRLVKEMVGELESTSSAAV